jgi:hypothetical protein
MPADGMNDEGGGGNPRWIPTEILWTFPAAGE